MITLVFDLDGILVENSPLASALGVVELLMDVLDLLLLVVALALVAVLADLQVLEVGNG